MKRYLFALTILIFGNAAFAASTLEDRQFFSSALDEDRWVQVYTPDGYDPFGSQLYPVVYFLHGAGGNHAEYLFLRAALDFLIATSQIDPVVVVKPDGSGCVYDIWDGCSWVNSETQGNYEDYIVQDLVAWVESEYAVVSHRSMRAIMGHSMGAFGAMHTALANPDVYAAVAAHSGFPYFGDFETIHLPIVVGEQVGPPPWTYDPADGLFTGAWFMLSGGFSPNPTNPPYFVDFPLDPFGNIIPSVWDRWLEHDPAALADVLVPGTEPDIYFDCGTADEFLLHGFNVSFDAHLTALEIEHRWRSYEGTHGNMLDDRFRRGLRFINNKRENPTAADHLAFDDPSMVLSGARPNPAREGTAIDFRIPRPGWASLKLYDVRGRLHATLVDRELNEGAHRVHWDTSEMPAGVYYYRLRAANRLATQRLVVSH